MYSDQQDRTLLIALDVYKKNGINIPITSYAQAIIGTAVSGGMSNWKAGDVMVYDSYVAIYLIHGTLIYALNLAQ